MFPLEYPLRVLKKNHARSRTILDPFCGRGTTLYAARHLGLPSWGIDTSPIAVAIARAKLARATLTDVTSLIDQLLAFEPRAVPQTSFFRHAFAPLTLKEVCAIREGLLRLRQETDASVLVRAAALGCLHGPLSKTLAGASYFSNQMPRTFATKPDYSVAYWKREGLKAPKVQVREILLRKLTRILTQQPTRCGKLERVLCADATQTQTYRDLPRNFSTVITSPPYYGMRTYIQDQWLRMWFLGGPEMIDYVADEQLNHNGHERFAAALAAVWRNVESVAAEDAHMYIRFGSVPSIKSDARKLMRASLEQAGGWRIVSTRTARDAHAGKRQADQMVDKSTAAKEYDFHVVRTA